MGNGYTITISGKSGCGNSTVSRLVAEKLGFTLVNYTFHSIADEQGIPFEELHRKAQEDDSWDRYLDRRQVEMASDGHTVLGSRLAIWLVRDADLSVYLEGSPEVRARRIQKREGGDYHAVLQRMLERDEQDHDRYLRLYGIDNNDYDFVNLVLDTTDLTPEQEAELILNAARERGIAAADESS
jgi:cytidylate kinase